MKTRPVKPSPVEWTEYTVNYLRLGCNMGCKSCRPRSDAIASALIRTATDWTVTVPKHDMEVPIRPPPSGRVLFCSNHDAGLPVFREYLLRDVDACLKAGSVPVVRTLTPSTFSPDDFDVVDRPAGIVVPISTLDVATAAVREPNAPPPLERLYGLRPFTDEGIFTTMVEVDWWPEESTSTRPGPVDVVMAAEVEKVNYIVLNDVPPDMRRTAGGRAVDYVRGLTEIKKHCAGLSLKVIPAYDIAIIAREMVTGR